MMDEMRLKLTTNFMKNIVAKLISRAIYKKYGCKVNIKLNDLDIWSMDGDTNINANVEVKINSKEFKEIMKTLEDD